MSSTAAAPSTAKVGAGDMPQSPPSTRHAIMDCVADESKFTRVLIHTAKCTNCNNRNNAIMRRCPGCTWQICTPCYGSLPGEPPMLLHGNMRNLAEATLPEVPARRVLMNRADSGPPRSVTTATGGGKRGAGVPLAGNPTDSGKKRTPAKRSDKKKGPVVKDTDSELAEEDGDRFLFDFDSPPVPTVRGKRMIEVDGLSESDSEDKQANKAAAPRTSTRNPPPTKMSPPPTKRARLSTAAESENVPGASLPNQTGKAIPTTIPTTAKTIPDRHKTLHELLEAQGVKYEDHFLSRHEPVYQDPGIYVPESVRRGFKPRTSAVEKHKKMVLEVLGQSSMAGAAEEDAASEAETIIAGGTSASQLNPSGLTETLRSFSKACAAKHYGAFELSDDQKVAIQGTMTAAVLVLVGKFNKELPAGLQRIMTINPDTTMDHLSDVQKEELEKVVRDATQDVMGHFKAATPTGIPSTPKTGTQQDHFSQPSSTPPMGQFQVSPPNALSPIGPGYGRLASSSSAGPTNAESARSQPPDTPATVASGQMSPSAFLYTRK